MSYEKNCIDFALYSNPQEEHYQDEATLDDYNREAFGGEVDQFVWCEDFTEEDHAWCDAHGVTDEASYDRAMRAEQNKLNIRNLL